MRSTVADEESRNPRPFRMVLHVSQGDMHSRASIDFGGTSTHMASVRIGPGDMRLGSESQSSYGNGTDTRSSLPEKRSGVACPIEFNPGLYISAIDYLIPRLFHFDYSPVEEMPDSVPIGARDATVIDRWLANAPKLQLLATAVASALPASIRRTTVMEVCRSTSQQHANASGRHDDRGIVFDWKYERADPMLLGTHRATHSSRPERYFRCRSRIDRNQSPSPVGRQKGLRVLAESTASYGIRQTALGF